MIRTKIEEELLNLPEAERAAIIQRVLATLSDEKQSALREKFHALEAAEEQELDAGLEALMLSWFDGPSEEMTQAEWAALRKGGFKYPPEEDSWATPPGWKSPRHQRTE